jgi:ABC-type spermidine/putrescine transport system permease subunit I
MICVLSTKHPPYHPVPFSHKIAWFVVFLVGVISNFVVESVLKTGIVSERWPESLLDAPRKLVRHPAVTVLGRSLIVAAFASIIFTRSGVLAAMWISMGSLISGTRIRHILRPPTMVDTSRLVPASQPLQSDHWGVPPHSLSQ